MVILLLLSLLSFPDPVYVYISEGENFQEVTSKLQQEGVIEHTFLFTVWARITGNDRRIKTGRYKFSTPSGVREVMRKLVNGETVDIKVTIPEGSNIYEVAEIFQYKTGMDSTGFINLVKDSTLIEEYNVDAPTLEGFLFPDTYFAFDSVPPAKVIDIMVSRFFDVFDSTMMMRVDSLGHTINEIITLASLIQCEVRVTEEMPVISSIYYNRLKIGRRLESCPTILYILPERKNRLLYTNLSIDSPYNTYKHAGLPPGAICNPGGDAIMAALYPAESDYLYFVAKGDGTHIFSKTHEEHINAKRRVGILK